MLVSLESFHVSVTITSVFILVGFSQCKVDVVSYTFYLSTCTYGLALYLAHFEAKYHHSGPCINHFK